MLLSLISSLVFRAIRDALPHDPVSQEKIVKASLIALAIADVSGVIRSRNSSDPVLDCRSHSKQIGRHSSVTYRLSATAS
jgi:hypothetical protein